MAAGSRAKYLANVKRALSGKSFDVIQIENRPRFVRPIKRLFPQTTVSLFLHSLTFVSPPKTSKSAAREGLSAADKIIVNSASLKQALSRRFPGVGVQNTYGLARRRHFAILPGDRQADRPHVNAAVCRPAYSAQRIARSDSGDSPFAGPAAHPAACRRRLAEAGLCSQYAQLARRLGVRAQFLGTVPHRRIHQIFRQADVFVCPSQKHEAFGLVNVEALATGLPVIASKIGGIGEIVRPGRNGYLIDRYRSRVLLPRRSTSWRAIRSCCKR